MTEYDLGKVVGDDGEAGNGIASITKTGTSGLVDTYTITYDDGTTTTFTVTNGSDASVTIQTSWGSTTSDSKVPSEKLTKDTLDTKIAKSSTTGLVKNDGSIMTGGTGSSNWAIGNHTHSGYVSASKVTSWSSTVSDSNVPSEKLVKNTIDGLSIPTKTSDLTNDGDGTNVFVKNNDSRLTDARTPTSHTHGNLTNDGKLGTTSGKPVITTTGGAITTGSFGSTSGTFAEGNHTHSGYVSATKVTSWQSTPSDSNVPSEKLVKDYVDGLIGSAISYIVGSGS